jgi:type IV secretion system protein TrbG
MGTSHTGLVALLLSLLLVAGACAGRTPAPRYFQAQPVPDPPRPPAVVTVPQPMPLPGQLRPVPPPNRPSSAPPRPCLADSPDRAGKKRKRNHQGCNDVAAVIAEANQKAAQNPDQDGYFNAIQTYSYDQGALYQIYSAPLRLTMISLQPGEKVVGKPAAGDTTRWQMALGKSFSGGVEQQHIYLKPSRPGLDTSMVITTDRRTYYLELHSFEVQYMAAVSWRYPQDEVAQLEAGAAQAEARDKAVSASLDLTSAYFGYQINVYQGHPSWTPEQVFDDGRRTFIRFPKSMMFREAPALFVLSSNREVQLVNYRVRNEYYVVDRLFDEAELRVGQDKQEIVRIKRR